MLSPEYESTEDTQPEVSADSPEDTRRHDLQGIADLTNRQTAEQADRDQAEADRQLKQFRKDFFDEGGISGHAMPDGRWFVENAAGQYMTFESYEAAYQAQIDADDSPDENTAWEQPQDTPASNPNLTGEMQEDILVADMTPEALPAQEAPASAEAAAVRVSDRASAALEPAEAEVPEQEQYNGELEQRFRTTNNLTRMLHREVDEKLKPLEQALQGGPMAAELLQARQQFQDQVYQSSYSLNKGREGLQAQPDLATARSFSGELRDQAQQLETALTTLIDQLNQLLYRFPPGQMQESLRDFSQRNDRFKRDLARLADTESRLDQDAAKTVEEEVTLKVRTPSVELTPEGYE